ncbi:ABC transporter ATP-binding protein [Brevibacillus sp. B_LB10_24]|uniref:ABC transporter ATP-binding protein n=1 Tax=Brevibacillus sp. B_LB10_24 TaxID=3380645 RepID=UPI0038BC1418
MSVSIHIENVVKRYGDKTIVNGLSLDIKPGELFTLLGPSGCGKTTLLRMIIGFNSIEEGVIKVDNQVINNIPVSKRNMGMVFQNYAIFPHLSVKDNVAFGLKQQKLSKSEIESRIEDILRVVKIEDYKDRMPDKLSGGQQQRVALARAIVIHPQVLLMDEPLSNLDAKLRVEMRNAIKSIQQQVGITTVYVTHDQEEALAISDRIAVMNGGIIQQIGTPKEIYERPANVFVSKFIGTSNIIEATAEIAGGETWINFGNGYKEKMSNLADTVGNGAKVLASVRPQEFIVCSDQEAIRAVVKSSMFLGLHTHYFAELANGETVEVVQDSDIAGIIPNGTEIHLRVKPNKINVFDADTQTSLIKAGGENGYKHEA